MWADLLFEGADDLAGTMRKAYAERQIPADCGARTDATFSNNKVTRLLRKVLALSLVNARETPLKAGARVLCVCCCAGPGSPPNTSLADTPAMHFHNTGPGMAAAAILLRPSSSTFQSPPRALPPSR